jgi:glucose-6-phosphate 1-dehydrogenase
MSPIETDRVDRARDSLAKHGGGVDEQVWPKLLELLQYIDGDYEAPETFAQLKRFRRVCSRL